MLLTQLSQPMRDIYAVNCILQIVKLRHRDHLLPIPQLGGAGSGCGAWGPEVLAFVSLNTQLSTWNSSLDSANCIYTPALDHHIPRAQSIPITPSPLEQLDQEIPGRLQVP